MLVFLWAWSAVLPPGVSKINWMPRDWTARQCIWDSTSHPTARRWHCLTKLGLSPLLAHAGSLTACFIKTGLVCLKIVGAMLVPQYDYDYTVLKYGFYIVYLLKRDKHVSYILHRFNVGQLQVRVCNVCFPICRATRDLLGWVPESQYHVPTTQNSLPHASEGMRPGHALGLVWALIRCRLGTPIWHVDFSYYV